MYKKKCDECIKVTSEKLFKEKAFVSFRVFVFLNAVKVFFNCGLSVLNQFSQSIKMPLIYLRFFPFMSLLYKPQRKQVKQHKKSTSF
jgi:hypothetical protein